MAISSASLSAPAPRAASFSRGRSSFGISRILSGAVISLVGKIRRRPAGNLAAQLIEQFTQRFAQREKRIDATVRGERREFGLGGADQFRGGFDGSAERAVGRR